MLKRACGLFRRYAVRHLVLTAPGGAIEGLVRIDSIGLRNGRLRIAGQSSAERIVLQSGDLSRSATPSGPRDPEGAAFRFDLPWQPGPAQLLAVLGGDTRVLALAGLGRRRVGLARLALLPGFALASLRASPAIWRWYRHHDPRAVARVRHVLGLDLPDTPQKIDPEILSHTLAEANNRTLTTAGPVGSPGGVTIVLPVFNALDLLPDVLDRVLRHTDLPFHLIVIEDCSTDPAVRPFLRDWVARQAKATAKAPRVTLLENAENLGFIGSVNRGFAAALAEPGEDPVLLLNSDALLPAGWAARLLRPLAEDASVASVTPMSNDAELLSVPVLGARLPLAPGQADRIDRVAQRLDSALLPEMPTGVGFCMALNRSFLRRLPAFDTAFGKGYGEEVDWSRKVLALGGRHLGLPTLFVEHRGAASFGSAEKQRLLGQNGPLISARYSGFDAEVQGFIGSDPLAGARLTLALAWADARSATAPDGRVKVYLGHALGGGAEHDLARRVAADLGACGAGAAVVLRVGDAFRWRIEVHSPAGITCGGTEDTALMLHLLRLLSRREVVYSCGVGDADPAELPAVLLKLGQGEDHRIRVLIHDYLPLSPSYTLLDADGIYRGLPSPTTTDIAHRARRPGGQVLNLAGWQAAWAPPLKAAQRIVVFSEASQALVAAAYPAVAARIAVRPHPLPAVVAGLGAATKAALAQRNRHPKPVIGVLGNIGLHKGAGVVTALARRLARDGRAGLVVIGNVDPRHAPGPPARVHGSYDIADLPALVARYGITCWLIPSVWPETFSFVTHEALATGLPVWSFDLGAQGAAVQAAVAQGAPGGVIPLRDGATDLDALLAGLLG